MATRRWMTPASSSFWMRRQQGVVDSPTSLPMSATDRVQSCCRIFRILTSISSSMGMSRLETALTRLAIELEHFSACR